MKISLFLRGTALAAVVTCSSLHLRGDDHGGLRVRTSVEVEFGTETNRYYVLQGSRDLQTWTTIGDPVYGNGQAVKRLFSTVHDDAASFGAYRLALAESTNVSHAPWQLTGLQLSLSDDSGLDSLRFTTSSNGLRHVGTDDTFNYTYLKTAENAAELGVVLSEGRSNRLVLQFSTDLQGSFELERYRDARLKSRALGTFTLGPIPTDPTSPTDPSTGGNSGNASGGDPTPPAAPSVPTELTGRAFAFFAGGEPDRFEFTSTTAGLKREDRVKLDDDGGAKAFTYTYQVTATNQASLNLDYGRGRTEEVALQFSVGEQGSFVRRELRDGILHDIDRGRFSPAGAATPTTGNTGNNSGGSSDDHGGGSSGNSDSGGGDDTSHPDDHSSGGGSTDDNSAGTGSSTDDHGHGTAVEPGDDKGGNSNGSGGGTDDSTNPNPPTNPETPPSNPDDNSQSGTVEPGDDHGGHGADDTTPGNSGGTDSTTPVAPAALTGLGLNFGSDLFQFSTATTGVKTGSGSPDSFTYEYHAADTGVATVKIAVKSDRWYEVTLTFDANGQGGAFVQKEFRSGALKDQSQGRFTVVR